jgi:hypothetical protein
MVVLGEDELAQGLVIVKNLVARTEDRVPRGDMVGKVLKCLGLAAAPAQSSAEIEESLFGKSSSNVTSEINAEGAETKGN